MSKIISVLVGLSLAGCMAGVQTPPEVRIILVKEPVVTNPCAYTNDELAELVRYERVIRQGFGTEDKEVVDRLLLSKRNYIDSKVQKRCDNYAEYAATEKASKLRADREIVQESWEAKSTYIPQPRAGEDPLPESSVEGSSFWCRNLTDECFESSERCETFANDLFECHTVAKAACTLYSSSVGKEVGCFANTETCNTFCGGREEGFNGKFACMTECRVLSSPCKKIPA